MQRNKRLLYAIPVIILLAGLVVYRYGFQDVRARISALREERSMKMEMLNRYNALISKRPAIEARLAELKREREGIQERLIEAQTASLAAATLQNMVKSIFTGNGGTISSERVEKTEEKGAFRVVGATINGTVPDTGTLKDILYEIETHIPYLMIKRLDVRVRNYRRPTGVLTVNITVSALTAAR